MSIFGWSSEGSKATFRRPAVSPEPIPSPVTTSPRRVTAPAPIAGVVAHVEQAYAVWCATRAIKPKALEALPAVGEHAPGDGRDARRSTFNPDFLMVGDRWALAPLSRPSDTRATVTEPAPFVLSDQEREWLKSDEAKAIAADARARQDVREDELLCAEVDALIAERNGGAFADVELPWIADADPAHAAEVAAVQAKWDAIDAAVAARRQSPGQAAA